MVAAPDGDPRVDLGAAEPGERGVAPRVALPGGGPSGVVIAIGMAILALLLFNVLNARRTRLAAVAPSTADRAAAALPAPPPALYVPPDLPAPAPRIVAAPRLAPPPPPSPPPPQIVYVPQPAPAQVSAPSVYVPPTPPRTGTGATLVFDASRSDATPVTTGPRVSFDLPGTTGGVAGARVRAGVLANRSSTVPQGTLIPAVLETGFDSTRPGLARAMVTSDVRGFDGQQVLVPRGSRLIGEYRSDAQPGQKRALVNWTRLIRPDGVTIEIGSPATDPVGRGGIGAKVDNHFFARFAGAILQSTLDVGVNLASRSTRSPVIVALPNAAQSVTSPLLQGQRYQPTLSVRPGTSISVFVARDLEFAASDDRP